MSKTIALTKGQAALVDDDDYERLNRHTWCACWNSCTCSFYARRSVRYGKRKYNKNRTTYMAREIMHAQPGQEVDHINGDTLDNRKANLRLCTRSENKRNRKKRKKCSSQYKGVCWYERRCKWYARIIYKSRTIHLGYFDDERDAACAYDAAATKYHGEFARLNFSSSKQQPTRRK